MKSYISFNVFDLKYFICCILFLIIDIFFYLFIFYDDSDENIVNKNILLDPSCLFLGLLLNIIPEWIINKRSNNREYLSIKEIIQIFL